MGSVSSRLPAPLLPHQTLLRPPRQFLVVLGNCEHHALGLGIGHLLRVGARFLGALPPVRGIIEATVGHDTPYAAVCFAPVRIHPSMARCLRLACEAGRARGPRLVRLGSADEMLEYGCRDGYMLYEPMFRERKRATKETYAEILFLVP